MSFPTPVFENTEIHLHYPQLANRQDTTLEGLQEELAAWETAYRSSKAAAGPAKWRLHAEFIQDTYSSIVRGLVQRKEQATQAELAAAAQRATDVEHRLHQVSHRDCLYPIEACKAIVVTANRAP